jgi:hypothetical protein
MMIHPSPAITWYKFSPNKDGLVTAMRGGGGAYKCSALDKGVYQQQFEANSLFALSEKSCLEVPSLLSM